MNIGWIQIVAIGVIAVVTLGVWSALLTLSGTYDQITAYVVFGSWVFYGLAAASVIILRRKMPDVERPFRTWGFRISQSFSCSLSPGNTS